MVIHADAVRVAELPTVNVWNGSSIALPSDVLAAIDVATVSGTEGIDEVAADATVLSGSELVIGTIDEVAAPASAACGVVGVAFVIEKAIPVSGGWVDKAADEDGIALARELDVFGPASIAEAASVAHE